MMNKEKERQVRELRDSSALVRIGKNGINENVILEIEKLLKKYEAIKIKILKPSMDTLSKQEIIEKVSEKTQSEVLYTVGLVFIVYRKSKTAKESKR